MLREGWKVLVFLPPLAHSEGMKKRIHMVLMLLLVGIAGVLAWQFLRPREHEPVYQGKTVRLWLHEYRPGAHGDSDRAAFAIRQIGTNAVPTLLHMLRKKDSPLVSKLVPLWGRYISRNEHLPFWFTNPAWFRYRAFVVNMEGAYGFGILGADAHQAVPELMRIYEEKISADSQMAVTDALVSIGPRAAGVATPSLLRSIANGGERQRARAIEVLWSIHAAPSLVVPVFAKCLSDSSFDVRIDALRGIQFYGAEAREAVPSLVRLLNDTDSRVSGPAAYTLKIVDSKAAAKAGVK
jgi:hypothetical protein